MSQLLINEQIKMLAKQLKVPTFATYSEQLRQASPDSDFADLIITVRRSRQSGVA